MTDRQRERDRRAIMAARNNADWYAMMFDIHGLRYERSEIAFVGIDPPPPYHSRMTTLDPRPTGALRALVSEQAGRPGFGIKDSFDCLPLVEHGLTELFSASWIHADAIRAASTKGWTRIRDADDLALWERAWNAGGSPSGERQFPATVLERPDVAFYGRRAKTEFDAGVVANLSSDCVGLSNCFGEGAFGAAATLCAKLGRDLPVVSYVRNDGLDAALACGFEKTGSLRVWTGPSA
ncbi:MAG: hypothetical protein HKN20_05265 [Gemmatimonadetes bacterium]|nr:hypothetical protein [Gemmatimonadota bacterium]